MDIHEFQVKQLFLDYQIPVSPFCVVSSLEEAKAFLEVTGWQKAVVKAQIHAGGRGKSGGVKIAHSSEDILSAVKELLGKRLVNSQTGPKGMVAHQLLISPLSHIKREYYLSVSLSREKNRAVLLASAKGGIEIEQETDHMLVLPIPPEGALRSYHLTRLMKWMGWKEEIARQAKHIVPALVKLFMTSDASLLEINPLVETEGGQLLALDAKGVIDDNALYRQPRLKAFLDPSQMHPLEVEAQKVGLAYVALDGDIGCMVNGAGLAMATMDLIHHYGGRPANFLDVGGNASQENIEEGFKMILADSQVKAILVNIFGGIVKCEIIASGVLAAIRHLQVSIPIVVRLEGTHKEKGEELLREAKEHLFIIGHLDEAIQQVVQIARQRA